MRPISWESGFRAFLIVVQIDLLTFPFLDNERLLPQFPVNWRPIG